MPKDMDKKMVALRSNRVNLTEPSEPPAAPAPARAVKRLSMDFDAELHRLLLIRRANGHGTLTEQVEAAVRAYLERESG